MIVRERKFRGKRIDNGKWVAGNSLTSENGEFAFIVTGCERTNDYGETDLYATEWAQVDPATVGGFTGLKDKNGVDIYEGDIARQNGNNDDLVKICFGEFKVYDIETEQATDFAVGWYRKVLKTDALSECEPFCCDMPLSDYWIKELDIEIIDNPELLDVQS